MIIELIDIVLISKSGGIFLSWIGIIFYSLSFLFVTLIAIFHKAMLDYYAESNLGFNTSEEYAFFIGFGTVTIIFIVVVLYVVLSLRLWASICLLNGIEKVSLFRHLFQINQ